MFHKILIPLDGSKFAEAALPPARYLAGLSGAEIMLVQARQIPNELGFPLGFPVAPEVLAAEKTRCEEYLESVAAPLREAQLKIDWSVMPAGNPAHEISEFVGREGCDLVIMTSHGRGGFAHAVMGSVAEKVARMSPCPVMIVGCRSLTQSEQ